MGNIVRLKHEELLNGTCFQGSIKTTKEHLVKVFGKPSWTSRNVHADKSTNEWWLLLGDIPFALYDWKEYRRIKKDEVIEWHIGASSQEDFIAIESELKKELALA